MSTDDAKTTPNEQANQGRIQGLGATRLEMAVEALIFASDEPVPAAQLAKAFSDVTGEAVPAPGEITDMVESINGLYERTGRAFRIAQWGGGYRFATVPDVAPFVEVLVDTSSRKRLSRTLMETLAILAYRQPTTRSDIEFVRGVDCDYAIRKLMEYGLVDVVGRSEGLGRPLLYGTTDRFLDLFGLASIGNLPNLREIEAILDDPAFQKEKAKLLMTAGLQQHADPGADSWNDAEGEEE